MGLCVTCEGCKRYTGTEIHINHRAHGKVFQNSSFSQEDERKKSSPSAPNTIGSATYSESTHFGSDLLKCDTTQTVKPARISQSVLGPKIPLKSYYTDSDSSEGFDLLSFGGLSRRTYNRNDIGMEVLKAKIHFGADPKSSCHHRERTSLMISVVADDFGFTKRLVEMGVDINQTNSHGETALGLAIELQRNEIADYLRSKGAADVVISLE